MSCQLLLSTIAFGTRTISDHLFNQYFWDCRAGHWELLAGTQAEVLSHPHYYVFICFPTTLRIPSLSLSPPVCFHCPSMSAPFQSCIPLFNICQVPPAWAAPELCEKSTITRLSEIPGSPLHPLLPTSPQASAAVGTAGNVSKWERHRGPRRSLQDKAVCILSSWKDVASECHSHRHFLG